MSTYKVFSTKAKIFFCFSVFVLLLMFAPVSYSQDYGVGSEGVKGGSLPGPGYYYLLYSQYYTSDKSKDRNGNEENIGFDLKSVALVNRFVMVTDKKIFGADYGLNVIIPVVNVDIDIDTANINESSFGIGDINIEPVVLGWHGQGYDAILGVSLYLPTGKYNKNDPSSVGKDHYTVMISTGGTLYPDSDKLWSFSILTRYEKHFENRDEDITYGDDFSLDWGIGRQIRIVNLGISGYAHWQLTEDRGDDAVDKDVKDHIYAIGPEVQVDVPALKGQIRLKYYKEFEAKDAVEGDALWLTLVKSF